MPNQITAWNVSHFLSKNSLLVAINLLAGVSIFFFGYDQGLNGGLNVAPDYVTLMGFATVSEPGTENNINITDSLLQGGISAAYYVGTLVGALLGGWACDKLGRIKCIAIGAAVGCVGASLQCSAQNHNWMICARVVNGFGTGILNAVVPVWSTETSTFQSRGLFVAVEFTLNIFGVVVAYWLAFGLSYLDDGLSPFRWRFAVGFQIIFLVILLAICWFFPESPRWLVKVGRRDEARYVLGRLRGEDAEGKSVAEAEFQDIIVADEHEKRENLPTSYWSMLTDFGKNSELHLGRRVQLVIWLQIMQEWVGIAGVTIYAPTIFRIAGFTTFKANWISGLNNITYMIATLICVFTLDKIGRRWTLYWGSVVQGISMFLLGAFSYLGTEAFANGENDRAAAFGDAAAAMIFIFTATFGATWLTVPWLYPAEIFPLHVRGKGNAWGVVGWSMGNGWLVLLLPVAFQNIREKTYYLFGIANIITIPIVWALYPESNQRTLEQMDLLFASNSPWNWEAEKNFARLVAEKPEMSHAAFVRGANAHHIEDGSNSEEAVMTSESTKIEGHHLEK